MDVELINRVIEYGIVGVAAVTFFFLWRKRDNENRQFMREQYERLMTTNDHLAETNRRAIDTLEKMDGRLSHIETRLELMEGSRSNGSRS